jgi:hypothetical protein
METDVNLGKRTYLLTKNVFYLAFKVCGKTVNFLAIMWSAICWWFCVLSILTIIIFTTYIITSSVLLFHDPLTVIFTYKKKKFFLLLRCIFRPTKDGTIYTNYGEKCTKPSKQTDLTKHSSSLLNEMDEV